MRACAPTIAPADRPIAAMPVEASRWFIVSRHPGAVQWMRQRLGARPVTVLTHLDNTAAFGPGDVVCGVLPLAWVARLGGCGARALVLEVELPASLRGQELGADALRALGAALVEYRATRHPCGL